MLSGIKSNDARGILRYEIFSTIMQELDNDNLNMEEKEELVKWYEDNLVICSSTLREKLGMIKGD